MPPLLNLPLDFELCDPVRRLSLCGMGADQALVVAFRLWVDWGRSGKDWRPLDHHDDQRDLCRERLVRLLEDYCKWKGNAGDLVKHCIDSGLIIIERRGSLDGFVLADFWECNKHLSPHYKTMQQRGGSAKAKLARLRDSDDLAEKQSVLLAVKQPELPLVSGTRATEEERKKAVLLIMRLDIACNRQTRITSEYEKSIVAAVDVVRRNTFEDVDAVSRYLIANDDQAFDPDHVLLSFNDLLRKTK